MEEAGGFVTEDLDSQNVFPSNEERKEFVASFCSKRRLWEYAIEGHVYIRQIPSGLWQYLFFQLQSLIKRFFYPEPACNFLVSDCDYFPIYQTILLFCLANLKSCICCLQVYINCYSGGFRSIDIVDILRTSHIHRTSPDRILLRTKKKPQVPLKVSLLHWILRINKNQRGCYPSTVYLMWRL